MNWFVYGYTKRDGHHFHTPVDRQFERGTIRILYEGIYGSIPNDTAFVGHFRTEGRWLVLAKRAGEGDILGRLLTEEQYRGHGFSPYCLVHEEVPDTPVTKIDPPLTVTDLTLPLALAPGLDDYINVCARIFEGFGEDRRRRVPHRSVSSQSATDAQAFFRLDEKAGREALDQLIDDGAGSEPPEPQGAGKSARLTRAESRIVELDRQMNILKSTSDAHPAIEGIESRVARLEATSGEITSIRRVLSKVDSRIDGLETASASSDRPEGEKLAAVEASVSEIQARIEEISRARSGTPPGPSAGKPLAKGGAELPGQGVTKTAWRRFEIMAAAVLFSVLGGLVAYLYASVGNLESALASLDTELAAETGNRKEAVGDLNNKLDSQQKALDTFDTELAAETRTREEAVDGLNNKLDSQQGALDTFGIELAAETRKREEAVGDLNNKLDSQQGTLDTFDIELAAETRKREEAVGDLNNKLDSQQGTLDTFDIELAAETRKREEAVRDLKTWLTIIEKNQSHSGGSPLSDGNSNKETKGDTQ